MPHPSELEKLICKKHFLETFNEGHDFVILVRVFCNIEKEREWENQSSFIIYLSQQFYRLQQMLTV